MKKLILTIGISGVIWLTPNAAFASLRQVTLNNQSTIESITIYEEGGNDEGSWWCGGVGCISLGTTGTPPFLSGTWAMFAIPPQSSGVMYWDDKDGYMTRWVDLYATPISTNSINPIMDYVRMRAYCSYNQHEVDDECVPPPAGTTGTDWTNNNAAIWPTPGFTYTGSSPPKDTINYSSSSCPSLADASGMLNKYAPGACPNSTSKTTFPDQFGRQWSITCPNNNVPDAESDPLNMFNSAQINVLSTPSSGHTGIITCNYSNSVIKNYNATFTNQGDPVILPESGVGNWITWSGASTLTGQSTCAESSDSSPNGCQWLYAASPY